MAHGKAKEYTGGVRTGAFLRDFCLGFVHASRGVLVMVRGERNARVHLAIMLMVVAVGFLLRISPGEWLAVVLASGLVWTAEALNTAIEYLGDAITTETHPLVRNAKDVAAGGVLIASITAVVVGLVVFLPKIAAWG